RKLIWRKLDLAGRKLANRVTQPFGIDGQTGYHGGYIHIGVAEKFYFAVLAFDFRIVSDQNGCDRTRLLVLYIDDIAVPRNDSARDLSLFVALHLRRFGRGSIPQTPQQYDRNCAA